MKTGTVALMLIVPIVLLSLCSCVDADGLPSGAVVAAYADSAMEPAERTASVPENIPAQTDSASAEPSEAAQTASAAAVSASPATLAETASGEASSASVPGAAAVSASPVASAETVSGEVPASSVPGTSAVSASPAASAETVFGEASSASVPGTSAVSASPVASAETVSGEAPASSVPGAPETSVPPVSGGDPAAQLAMESGLPVISVVTEDGALPGDAYAPAQMTVWETEGGRLRSTTCLIEIRERGNTSRRFPKKSYRVTIVDEDGEKEHVSLLGMRSDDDWILNPMYSDTSKIREALAYSLWEEMNSSSVFAASSRVRYAEVYINGEYWGLYGLQERIDRKQVKGDKRSGVIYKIIANDRPSVEELLLCESDGVCRGFELEFSGAGVRDPWEPAAAYMAMLNGEPCDLPAVISEDNVIDYGLWAMLCQAHDCHFKNQFLNCVFDGSRYTVYKIPWDLNNTFGDVWSSSSEETNYTEYYSGRPVTDGAFAVLLEAGDPAFIAAVQERWRELRGTVITEERLIAMAHALHDPLADAILRDSLRWPLGGMGNGNAVNIRDIESYIRGILPRMDEYISGLSA